MLDKMLKNKFSHKFIIKFLIMFFISIVYFIFMDLYSPLGTDWLDFHAQRIYNFSEYLKINGYFSKYGFSIWNSCEDCSLKEEFSNGKIYKSKFFFSLAPYLFLNHFFNKEVLLFFGPIFDKFIVFACGVLLCEIVYKLSEKKYGQTYSYFFSMIVFIFFLINPWTYKMIIAAWHSIYFFLLFFFAGLLSFLKKKQNIGIVFFLLASLCDYQSACGLIVLYLIPKLIELFSNKKINLNEFFLLEEKESKSLIIILFSLCLGVSINFLCSISLALNTENLVGSSFLSRIGISGIDIHNGSILGSLQFLAGNRINVCIFNNNISLLLNETKQLNNLIEIYNCFLSLGGMFILSLISVYGIIKLYTAKESYRIIILPVGFLLLGYTSILQQSTSAHLMGYSFLFSVIFSLGISYFIIEMTKKTKFFISKIIFTIPIGFGFLLLCIRVNMLTGING